MNYLWLYGIGHIVKDQSNSERGNQLMPLLAARVILYAPFYRQVDTMIFVRPVLETAQWVCYERLIR